MCNIAGYAGTRLAAPILIEMMKKQEGFLGGYYTGIATIHQGKIYYAKITGDTDRLVALTNAALLPGTVGIIHSRSKSGGGDKWAHPFVTPDENGDPYLAYVANGAAGFFNTDENKAKNKLLAESLMDAGYTLDSLDTVEDSIYTTVKGGMSVHMSDVMCQLVWRNMKERGLSAPVAMKDAFLERPGEIVGLLLALEDPDAIAYARYNMPMFVAFSSHGAYLSSTPLAMPADRGEHTLLPAGTYGKVYKNHFECHDMGALPASISQNNARMRRDVFCIVEKMLSEGKYEMREINLAAREAFPNTDLKTIASVTYDVLTQLDAEGRLDIEVREVEGAFPELTAPKFFMSLK